MSGKILVPLDGSELAERALAYAVPLATRTGASVLVLRAAVSHTLPGVDPRERQAGAIDEAQAYVDDVIARVQARNVACEAVVRYGHPSECIVESARTRQVDLIVMASHGRTGPGRWILGAGGRDAIQRPEVASRYPARNSGSSQSPTGRRPVRSAW